MARRPSTTEPRRIGMPSTTTGPIMLPIIKERPFKKRPPIKQFLQRPLSIEQRRPPTIEERVAKVLSGPSFPGRQMPKVPEQPMRMPEPVGPVTDMRTMPSMPTTGIASLSDVLPLIDMGGEDIMQLLSGLPKTPPTPVQPPVMPISGNMNPGSQIVDDEPYRDSYRMMEDPEERMARRRREMEESILNMPKLISGNIDPGSQIVDWENDPNRYGNYRVMEDPEEIVARRRREMEESILNTPKLTTDPIPDPITGDRYPVQPMMPLEILPAPETAPSPEPMMPPEDFSLPIPSVSEPMMPPAPETETALEPMMPPAPETETTPVQGMTMEQMQQMIADMQAQQQEQAAARAAQEKEMAQNYMVPGSRMGYNPYLSGQYQSDPYGPSGVPNMGGITTIPVPDGYGIYNPVYGR